MDATNWILLCQVFLLTANIAVVSRTLAMQKEIRDLLAYADTRQIQAEIREINK